MAGLAISASLVSRLYERAGAARWKLEPSQFARALAASAAHAFGGPAASPSADQLEHYLGSLHLDDLALAAACQAGIEQAWAHFLTTYRPVLERAADAIDATGAARDLAETLYSDLYGVRERDGERQSLLQYFHGRSRLGTWLRAVLAQRHIDHIRAARRVEPVDDVDAFEAPATTVSDPERARFLEAMRVALKDAVAALASRDRLRLACYYAQDMTLAAIGRMLKEHEATVSRHLARTRRDVKAAVEHRLKQDFGMSDAAVAECFRSVAEDAGTLDLAELVGPAPDRKIPALDRSTG